MGIRGCGARILLLAAVVGTIGCDRVTKHVAATSLAGTAARSYLSGALRLEYAENTGGFLGAGAELPALGRSILFTGATGLALLGLALAAAWTRLQGLRLLGVALFVSGGASNWFDRVMTGSVIDFLNVGLGPVRTGIFNVADVAIMCGAGLLLIGEIRATRLHPPDAQRT